MNALRRQANVGVGERIKTWLCSTSHRPRVRPTFRPGLESLEHREVPSAAGLDPAQLQAGLNYLGQVVQQQTTILQKDIGVLTHDVQGGQTGRIGADVQRLQNDFQAESQALAAAINAVLSGHIPSSTPAATTQIHTATAASHQTIGESTSSPNSTSPRLISERTSSPSGPSTGASRTGMDSTDWMLLDWLDQNYDPSVPSYDPFASSANWWTAYNDWGVVASGNLFDSAARDLFSYSPIADGYAGPGSYE